MRPKDYGDQKPSDLDDVTPADPTDGFSELDYTLSGPDAKKFKTRDNSTEAPGRPDQEQHVLRTDWTGIILGWANARGDQPRRYWVLRQDGKLGTGRTLQQLERYHDYRPGDDVGLIEDNVPNEFVIVGSPKPLELPQMYLQYNADGERAGGNVPFVIPFDTEVANYPIDNSFGGFGEIEHPAPGSILVTQQALYDIHAVVVLEHDESLESHFPFWFEVECPPNPTNDVNDDSPIRVSKLSFSKQQAFKLKFDPAKCVLFLEIKAPLIDSLLNQQTEGGAFWTQDIKLGGNLSLGTQVGQGWLKFHNVWLSAEPGGNAKILLPSSIPEEGCSYLIAKGITPEDNCVQLGWQDPGGNGVLKTLEFNGSPVLDPGDNYALWYGGYYQPLKECSYIVEHGLIISDSCGNISPPECNFPAICDDTTGGIYDPCGEQ